MIAHPHLPPMSNHHSPLKESTPAYACVRERERELICVYIRSRSEHIWETLHEQSICTIGEYDVIYCVCMDLTVSECTVIDWVKIKGMHLQCDVQLTLIQCVTILDTWLIYFQMAAAHLQRAAHILNACWYAKIICTQCGLPVGDLSHYTCCANPPLILCSQRAQFYGGMLWYMQLPLRFQRDYFLCINHLD